VLSNSLNKTSLSCPMTPVVADYRARNLLILRVPATARVPVTAEAAGSSPVVPAILNGVQPRHIGDTPYRLHR